MRKLGLKAGQFADDRDFGLFADQVIPKLEDAFDGDPARILTIEEEVSVRVYKALEAAASKKPKLLSRVWEEYIESKGIDVSIRSGERKVKRWQQVFACIGEQQLDNNKTLDAIHAGLDRYWEERRDKRIKVQSIRREYAETVAALRLASDKYRLGWVIVPNSSKIKADPIRQKVVLSQSELTDLVMSCLSDTKTPAISASIIFMAQSGAMCSEIERLNPDEVLADLDAAIPQISIGKSNSVTVKAEERRRVVPIVLGVDYLKRHIVEAIELCNQTTESNISHRIGDKMRRDTGNNKISAHCLRHTLRALSDIADANQSHVAAIGGWAGANKTISSHMQQYGAEGLSRSEGFKAVTATSREILGEVIEAVEADQGNVVSIRTKA